MNTKELNFAYKVRLALNENLDHLPAASVERLAAARTVALSRKKKNSPLRVFANRYQAAGASGAYFAEPFSWRSRMGVAVPILLVAAGLIGIFQFEQQKRIHDTAEIDTQLLTDELPLSAYMDHGFNAYLAKRGE